VYRKATDFCKLILDPDILQMLILVSTNVFVEFFKSFSYKIMLSANRDSLITSFPICIPYFFFLSYTSGRGEEVGNGEGE
jgi:hypothetical protein